MQPPQQPPAAQQPAAAAAPSASLKGNKKSWRRRVRGFVNLTLRQVPCLHAALPALACFRCCKSSSEKYHSLGQDEDNDGGGVEDHRQKFNQTFGLVMTRCALLCTVGITVKIMLMSPNFEPVNTENASRSAEDGSYGDAVDDFRRDSPIVLYMAAIELLACGACALTAASMYKRRRHQIVHPAESDEKAKRSYLEVHLSKEACAEEMPTYGIGFRPSSDGLECLLIESIRWGSLLDQWNRRQLAPTAEELVEEALEMGVPGETGGSVVVGGPGVITRRYQQVDIGAVVVAVNDVSGDVGMMQLQLLKPRVTLWIRDMFSHASQFEDNVAPVAEPPEAARASETEDRGDSATGSSEVIGRPAADSSLRGAGSAEATESQQSSGSGAPSVVRQNPFPIFGLAQLMGLVTPPKGPSCACVALEDEEPQILTRWLTCSLLFGWVTMLPVLFMQPHEDRPRQQLFRQFLLKPCLIIMPLWCLLWLLDCIQMAFDVNLLHPFYYFGIVHMLLPGVVVWYLMKMQAADEKLVVDQRAEREKQVDSNMLLAIEDPCPTLLKELIMMNPVALVWLGACVSIPIVICSFLTPLTTERGRLAQGYVNIIYTPMIFIQCAFAYKLWYASFDKLPQLYMALFGLLLSVHCFLVWCVCIVCSSKFGRRDLVLVQEQRLTRGRAAKEKLKGSPSTPDAIVQAVLEEIDKDAQNDIIDCTEAQNREWELIYTA